MNHCMSLPILRSKAVCMHGFRLPMSVCVISVSLLLLAITIPAATATGPYYPPYYASFYGGPPGSTRGCGGQNYIDQSPYANITDGSVLTATRSYASCISGSGAGVDTWEGFWGPTFTVSKNATYLIRYPWVLSWDAAIATSICDGYGSNNAEISLQVWGNLWDATHSGWSLGNDARTPVFSISGVNCGLGWSTSGRAQSFVVSFETPSLLLVGETYQFYTYMTTHTAAAADGDAWAQAGVNVGTSGDIGYIYHMDVL